MLSTDDVTFVCPHCGQPVSYSRIEFENGSVIESPDWECRNCKKQVMEFRRPENWKERCFILEKE